MHGPKLYIECAAPRIEIIAGGLMLLSAACLRTAGVKIHSPTAAAAAAR